MNAGKIPENSWMISLIGMAIKEVNESKSGWILLNFPRNSNQALLLEKELTG
jgi:adenylate kinase family enzyme